MPESASLIPLSELPHEVSARLVEIHGGRNLTRRLLALGLRQGSALSIVQRRGHSLVLASGSGRIAMGFGVAEKLWVTVDSESSSASLLETGPVTADLAVVDDEAAEHP